MSSEGDHDSDDCVDYYDEDDDNYLDDSDASEVDLEVEQTKAAVKNYTVLNEADISESQEKDIDYVSNILSVSRVSAIYLLLQLNWRVSDLTEKWFANEEKVRKDFGLFEQPDKIPVAKSKKKTNCRICFDTYLSEVMFSAASCDHLFCRSCWKGYIGTSINDGPGCLTLLCPDPSCKAVVGEDMVTSLVSGANKKKYSRYFLRSYVERSEEFKWCPAPGCGFAIKSDVGSENCDITCKCTYSFCWCCIEEAHRPVGCSTIAEWNDKNNNEAENITWILANSKACPKCHRPIEKNQGCMHMTCSLPCRYEFCWLCLGPWSEHGSVTGGHYKCNRYEKAKKSGVYDDEENKIDKAKKYIHKYAHYYERWALNHKSKAQAAEAKETQSKGIKDLSTKMNKPETGFQFISDAWLQIIECRRILKWTYAYGYYLPEDELVKKKFFEYLQGEAESALERLHQCAENEVNLYIKGTNSADGFLDFSAKLKGLTSVTGTYFENLVRAMENGLTDVENNRKEGASSKGRKSSKR